MTTAWFPPTRSSSRPPFQDCQAGDAPCLIRIDTKAGHGGGKPVSKQIEEYTDIYSFILYNMPEKRY